MPFYHVWFATRRRLWLLQGDVGESAKVLMFEIAADKGIKLLEAEAIVDHVHLLLDCEDKGALSSAMMFLKGVSSRRLGQQFPSIYMDAGTTHLWQERFGSKIIPPERLTTARRYIQTQWDRLESYDRPNRLKS
jgi:putative transposase